MNKATKYTINLALAGAVGNALFNIFNQRNKNPNTKIDWEKVLIASGKGALWRGATGLVIGAIKDEKLDETLRAAGSTSAFLHQTLKSYENDDATLENKANKIQMLLYQKFKYLLVAPPQISGSKHRGTSIVGSDIDIQVKFKRNAGTIEEVRNLIEDFFTEKFDDARLIKVRSQPCSIGLLFSMYGKEYRIDIVPMRAIGNNKGDAFLCVKENSIFQKDTITKTNSGLQSKSLKFNDKQKKIVKLLKGWKKLNDIELPSIYIELIVKRACNEIRLPKGLLRSVLRVVEYVGNNIRTIRIIDPANSNNIISDYLTINEKISIQNYCYKMIKDINEDERNIVEYFPYM